MTSYSLSPDRIAPPLTRPVELTVFALIVAHAVFLAAAYVLGVWMVQADGLGNPSDFVNVWAAGRLVLDGNPAAAYDWPAHKAVEEIAVGHAFDGYYGWHYPPPFLFVAAALATLPYAPSYALWVFATFPAYLAAIRGIVGHRVGYALAAAFPAVLGNFLVGQNGFLTAGLLGGVLLFVERRPYLAGVLLGLLTYKPHLGLLFPVVLAVSGHWRVFFTAAAVATVMAAISFGAFGAPTWAAFFGSISQTSQAFLSEGHADWSKLQTMFGLVRTLGGGEPLAWTLQGIVGIAVAVLVSLIWRTRVAYELKAAALATGAALVTPYLYTYDLVVLAVPLAFLFRLGRARGFLPHEMLGFGIACLLIASFPFVKWPVGLAAALLIIGLIVRRTCERSHAASA